MERIMESRIRRASGLILIVLLSPIIINLVQADTIHDLFYCTYFGGSRNDAIRDITIDSKGNIIVVGGTFSENFPVVNAVQKSYGGGELPPQGEYFGSMGDGVVAKFSPDYQLLWSTYLGGLGHEVALNVLVDSDDNVVVFGTTTSADFPVTDGSNLSGKAGGDCFITRFDPDGKIISSTYYAANEIGSINSVAKTPSSEVVLVGSTSSSSLYCTDDALQKELRGQSDGFIRVLSGDLGSILFSTYIGGGSNDSIACLAIGQDGSIFASGNTKSVDFPVTENCIQSKYGGGSRDGFIIGVSPDKLLVMGTYLGGSDQEDIYGISKASEFIILVGRTWSSDFPTTTNAYQRKYSGVEVDGFVSQISVLGDELIYSTFYGLNGWDSLLQVNLDEEGRALITGFVDSTGFETINAFQSEYMGYTEIIVIVVGEEIELISYLGGYGMDHPLAQVSSNGKVYLVGLTSSTQFPVSDNAYQMNHAGEEDGFLWMMNYKTYLTEEIPDTNGSDALSPVNRLYLSYVAVIGVISLWFLYIKRSFAS